VCLVENGIAKDVCFLTCSAEPVNCARVQVRAYWLSSKLGPQCKQPPKLLYPPGPAENAAFVSWGFQVCLSRAYRGKK
jgi:hypothetical protein